MLSVIAMVVAVTCLVSSFVVAGWVIVEMLKKVIKRG